MTTTPRLGLTYVPSAGVQKEVPMNADLNWLDALVQGVVQSVGSNTPPGSPAAGACYIVGTSPTGAWSGKSNQLAVYFGGVWNFLPALQGMRFYSIADTFDFQYTGSAWLKAPPGYYTGSGAPALTAVNNGDIYYDTSATPYTMYVRNGGVWRQVGAAGGGGGGGSYVVPVLTPPLASRFTWVNQGTSTWTDQPYGLVFSSQTQGTDILRAGIENVPATPWRVYAKFRANSGQINYLIGGLCISDGTKYVSWAGVGGTNQFEKFHWTTSTATAGTGGAVGARNVAEYWLSVEDTGSALNFYLSHDGWDWWLYATTTRTAFLASAPTKVGIMTNPLNTTDTTFKLLVEHYSFSATGYQTVT